MRIRIIFSLLNKGSYVPFYHQFLLSQFIEGVIYKGDSKTFSDFKLYNFSGLKGQTKVSRNGLHFYSSKITLVFSSPNEEFIQFFLNTLFSIKQFELGKLILRPESVELEERPQMSEAMKYICISPLVIYMPTETEGQTDENTDSKNFISPEYDLFSDLLYESTMQRLEENSFSQEDLARFYKFQLVPDKGYLAKIKQNNKKFARIYPVYDDGDKYEVRGYTFPFTLFAAEEVNDFIYNCGLGTFTHKGFGMVDLANQNEVKHTTPYSF